MNNGWGAAYNVTAGNEIIEIIHPGEIVAINRNGNFMQYHRLLQIGEEEDLTLMNINLTDIKSDNNESTPSLSFVSIIFCLMAIITFRRKK
jgi:hypothetical protein